MVNTVGPLTVMWLTRLDGGHEYVGDGPPNPENKNKNKYILIFLTLKGVNCELLQLPLAPVS